MALTSAEIVDLRRFCGYSVGGDSASYVGREHVYTNRSYLGMELDYRLQHLSTEEETVVRDKYLAKLNVLETAILDAGDNLDTDRAAVWYRNRDEVKDRSDLFSRWRRQLCDFLGFKAGPGLNDGFMAPVIRA